MAVIPTPQLSLDYDEEMDVLYASLGPPQPAISDEWDEDIWLRYCPPNPQVVGITIVNFRRHFPGEPPADVVTKLLQKFPVIPKNPSDDPPTLPR